MSIIIFFGFSLFIFILGVVVVSLTFYHWYKLAKEAKNQKTLAQNNN